MIDFLQETEKSKQNILGGDQSTLAEESTMIQDQTNEIQDDDEDEFTNTKNTRKQRSDEEDEDLDDQDFDLDIPLDANFVEDGNNTTIQDTGKNNKGYVLEHQFTYKKIKSEVVFIKDLLKVFETGDKSAKEAKKLQFYSKFFGLRNLNKRESVCMDYIKGLQFVMHYYFHGCPSWTWYYPYFMSPFLSDLTIILENNINNINISFSLDEPYKPFDQLAYILPRASLGLLPEACKKVLLRDQRTEKYYPEKLDDFEPFDAIHSYQWIAKLELFDDLDMAEVLNLIDESEMSDEEKRRNRRSIEEIFRYDSTAPSISVKSVVSGLPDFNEHIKITPFNLSKKYPFDRSKISYDLSKLDLHDGFPSLNIVKGARGVLQDVSRKAKYRRLIIEIQPDVVNPDRNRQSLSGFVFYDYPFRKIGYINTVVLESGHTSLGNLESRAFEEIVNGTRSNGPYNCYRAIQDDSTFNLFKEKGIDFVVKGTREPFYELEYRKSAWRTALDPKGKIIYEFDHVKEIYPHGLLVPFSKEEADKFDTQFRFPLSESDLFKPNFTGVSLSTGDLFKISQQDSPEDKLNIKGSVIRPNNNLVKELVRPVEILEDNWRILNASALEDLGLKRNEILIAYGLMDTFVIKTDSSQPSSLILGEMFDIGLRLFKALGHTENRLMIVTDLVK